MQRQCQGTDTQCCSQSLGILDAVSALDDCLTGCDNGVYTRYADKFVIIVDTDRLAVFVGTLCSLGKSLCTFGIKFQLGYIFAVAGIVLLYTTLGVDNGGTFEYDAVLFLQLVDRVVQLILACGRIVAVAGIAVVVRLADKIQRTRCTQLFEDLICIGNARDLNSNTVDTLFVNLCFLAVAHNTLLQLVHGIIHVFGGRHILICRIGDADTTGQIQTGNDVSCRTCTCRSETDCRCKCQQRDQKNRKDQDCNSLFFLHDEISFLLVCQSSFDH